MVFRDQTRLTGNDGDCFATCIECILELPQSWLPKPHVEDMVNQETWRGYYYLLKEKLEAVNIALLTMKIHDADGKPSHPDGLAVATFVNKHTEKGHSVVLWYDKVVHDPHPGTRNNPGEIGELYDYSLLVPIDPARPSGKFALKGPSKCGCS